MVPRYDVHVYVSQLISWYARACSDYHEFLPRAKLLKTKLLKQGYLQSRLKSTFKKLYGRHQDFVEQYVFSVTHMMYDIITSCWMSVVHMVLLPIYTPKKSEGIF